MTRRSSVRSSFPVLNESFGYVQLFFSDTEAGVTPVGTMMTIQVYTMSPASAAIARTLFQAAMSSTGAASTLLSSSGYSVDVQAIPVPIRVEPVGDNAAAVVETVVELAGATLSEYTVGIQENMKQVLVDELGVSASDIVLSYTSAPLTSTEIANGITDPARVNMRAAISSASVATAAGVQTRLQASFSSPATATALR